MDKKLNSKILTIVLTMLLLSLTVLTSCTKVDKINSNEKVLYVYNWGLYIDEKTIDLFEKETGIKVIYDMFDTNEEMYTKIKSGTVQYDCLCPSDYMIERMANEGMLYSYDFKTLTNYPNIDSRILNLCKSFDYENTYAIPYVYSTIGIVYNKTMLDKNNLQYPTSWSDLWKEEYASDILMQDAVRDLLMVALKKNNYSLNTVDKNEIEKACSDLIEQKNLQVSYVIDEVRDLMVSTSNSIGVTYSGEMEYIKESNPDSEYIYVIPKEGTNMTIDAWVIPANAQNKEYAKLWIDFMLHPDIAKMNYEYMHYGCPNLKVMENLGEEELNEESIFPKLDDENLKNYEIYKYLGAETEDLYLDVWKRVHNS